MFDAKDIGAVVAADPREVAAEYVCIGSRTAAADSAPGAAQPPCCYISHLKCSSLVMAVHVHHLDLDLPIQVTILGPYEHSS